MATHIPVCRDHKLVPCEACRMWHSYTHTFANQIGCLDRVLDEVVKIWNSLRTEPQRFYDLGRPCGAASQRRQQFYANITTPVFECGGNPGSRPCGDDKEGVVG